MKYSFTVGRYGRTIFWRKDKVVFPIQKQKMLIKERWRMKKLIFEIDGKQKKQSVDSADNIS